MRRNVKKVVVALLTLILPLTAVTPTTVHASPSPVHEVKTMSAQELENYNLSVGTIYWDDDLVNGYLEVREVQSGYGYQGQNNQMPPPPPTGDNGMPPQDNNGNGTPPQAPPQDNNSWTMYQVTLDEVYKMSDRSWNESPKRAAKDYARAAFGPVRLMARKCGWWDCEWEITDVSKNKVVAEAWLQYKAVRTGTSSRDITIKQITKRKKNGRWQTRFRVWGRSYTQDEIFRIFY